MTTLLSTSDIVVVGGVLVGVMASLVTLVTAIGGAAVLIIQAQNTATAKHLNQSAIEKIDTDAKLEVIRIDVNSNLHAITVQLDLTMKQLDIAMRELNAVRASRGQLPITQAELPADPTPVPTTVAA